MGSVSSLRDVSGLLLHKLLVVAWQNKKHANLHMQTVAHRSSSCRSSAIVLATAVVNEETNASQRCDSSTRVRSLGHCHSHSVCTTYGPRNKSQPLAGRDRSSTLLELRDTCQRCPISRGPRLPRRCTEDEVRWIWKCLLYRNHRCLEGIDSVSWLVLKAVTQKIINN